MRVVRFDQIARECRETFKGSFEGKPIVGLEHIEPYDMLLKNYDVDVETTFTKYFKKGQILFGRRRAYQHKACVATIDGICSGDITVIEPIEGVIYPDLLPFIIQNEGVGMLNITDLEFIKNIGTGTFGIELIDSPS